MQHTYLKNEAAHFCDTWRCFFEAMKVIFRQNEIAFFPPRKQFVTLLPQQPLFEGTLAITILKYKMKMKGHY